MSRPAIVLLAAIGLAWSVSSSAQEAIPGVSTDEIRIGQTMHYSGPASAFGAFGRVQAAYFQMVNDRGGINARRINFISRDDESSPPRTVEMTRRLVEQDDVLFLVGSAGTPNNTAVQRYLNDRSVPQLFIGSGASKWADPENYPWSMGWAPNYNTEAQIYARYILENIEQPRIAVLYQNDDFGRDLLDGLRRGLGERAGELIIAEASYEATAPTVDGQINTLRGSGANVFVNVATPKFAAQAIRRASDIGWDAEQFVVFISSSIGAVLAPAGVERAKGIKTIQFLKDYSDPTWADDAGMLEYTSFLQEYYPDANPADFIVSYGYSLAQTAVHVLEQAGDDLTRENVMRQAAGIVDLELPLLLPGIRINTSSTDFSPIRQAQLAEFDGTSWVLFGEVIGE